MSEIEVAALIGLSPTAALATVAHGDVGFNHQDQLERILERTNLKLDENGKLSYADFTNLAELGRPGKPRLVEE